MVKEYKETHQEGSISIENIPDELRIPGYMPHLLSNMQGDLGVQVAKDGRVWVCINGVAFLRFKPGRSEATSQLLDWFRKRQRETKSVTLTMTEFDRKYEQLFGSWPKWYSWGPFYRDHGFVGLRGDARVEGLGWRVCEHGNLRDECPDVKCRTL